MATPAQQPIDESKLNAFLGQAVTEMGAAMNAALIILGDKLGLYKAMAGAGPLTSAQVAQKTNLNERYVREWLSAQAAGGFLTYDAAAQTFTLPPEQAFALAMEDSPVFLPGFFIIVSSVMKDVPKIEEGFRTGKGVGWHEHDHELFHGTEKFFRPNYRAHLVSQWIPALDGVEAKLKAGAKVADVGCGLGTSTILMAQAYPKSTFVGFDYHDRSIELAREAAKRAGVGDRVKFEVARRRTIPGTGYDLVAFFDCLHDMGDPVGAAQHALQVAGAGRYVADRRAICQRQARGQSQPDRARFLLGIDHDLHAGFAFAGSGFGAGAQAGEARLTKVLKDAGFTRVRRATQTPFNMILEARP